MAIGRAVVRFLFKRPGVLRIVGEPDVRNHQFLSLLAFLGFRKAGEIDLPDKRAAFMVCEREDFERLSGRRRRVSATWQPAGEGPMSASPCGRRQALRLAGGARRGRSLEVGRGEVLALLGPNGAGSRRSSASPAAC